jgi:hypothetical protein
MGKRYGKQAYRNFLDNLTKNDHLIDHLTKVAKNFAQTGFDSDFLLLKQTEV